MALYKCAYDYDYDYDAICGQMAERLEQQDQQFFYNGIRALKNSKPSVFQLQETILKSDKI